MWWYNVLPTLLELSYTLPSYRTLNLVDPLVYAKSILRSHLKSMILYYPWWLHGLWRLELIWTRIPISVLNTTPKNILSSLCLKTYFFCDLRLVLKNLAQRLSWKSKFLLLLHLESDYSFLKPSPKAFWKSRFSFLFKCENILNIFGNT